MNLKNRLDRGAERLMKLFEEHAKTLPFAERDAMWQALDKVVAELGAKEISWYSPSHCSLSRRPKRSGQ